MAGKYKRGKNPGEVDAWLEGLGYYRKNVAYDETCLFRAVSEQVFHKKVRKECVEYGRRHPEEFQHLAGSKKHWMKHLDKLEIHMVVCGNIEIQLISKTYKRDIILFDGIKFEIENVTGDDFQEQFNLCLTNKDHYDVIHRKEYILMAGICQSIVYGVLYENVFGIEDVPATVENMLYGKGSQATLEEFHETGKVTADESVVSYSHGRRFTFSTSDCIPCVAPFPYKVAKALDPTIYRNIEYDTWTETRREMRLGEWYHGDDKLILGTCCDLKTESGVTLRCYIQEFIKGKEECVVYIPSLAERRAVKYGELSPEENAKPWPLPYRFSKNPPGAPPSPQFTLQIDRKNFRKNRDKKLSRVENGTETEITEHSVNAFEGCPLQMQQTQNAATNRSENLELASASPPSPEPAVQKQKVLQPSELNVPSPYPYGYPPSPFAYGILPPAPGEYLSPVSPPAPSPDPQGLDRPGTVFYVDVQKPVTPSGPPMELYPVYSLPATPVLYSPQEVPEVVLPQGPPPPSHVPVFTPPVDVRYVPASPFVYPPTPPGWYPPGVSSQGFIFPTPYNVFNQRF